MDKIYERVGTDSTGQADVAVFIVDDPLERGAKLKVLGNVRDDPLAGMLSRDFIDQAQFKAGRRWQQYNEQCQVGTIQAIDPGKAKVDGGRLADPITLTQMAASDKMNEANQALGTYGTSIIVDVLWRRMTIQEIAAARNMSRETEIKYIGKRFRECLETLAKLWGYA